ncbi:putative RNA-directed DNA polymerase from transposon X-element [Trichonephila clavipes]|nr:putative RNA-directed DNA polymerase from transposon X-element [Trichonephila clavipes]
MSIAKSRIIKNSAYLVILYLLNSDKLKLLYNESDIPTYLRYSGSGTKPDLIFSSADISDVAEKEVIYDPISGHGDSVSSFKQSEADLPQGTVISPLSFDIFINDLPGILTSDELNNAALFADDLAVWCCTSIKEQFRPNTVLYKSLEELEVWCSETNMTINLGKTTSQYFTFNRQLFTANLAYRGTLLQHNVYSTYLGCIFDNKLK